MSAVGDNHEQPRSQVRIRAVSSSNSPDGNSFVSTGKMLCGGVEAVWRLWAIFVCTLLLWLQTFCKET